MRVVAIASVMLVIMGLSYPAHAASGAASDPGVTARSIQLGGVLDQTGAGSIIARPILGGYELAIKEINAAGGINGRQIKYAAESDNYDPSQTLPQLKQVVEADHAFAVLGVFGSDDANVAAPYLENRHVPFFDPIGGGIDISGKHWIWQTEPDYAREGRVMAKYAIKTLGAKRIGILYQVGIGEPQVSAIKSAAAKYGGSVSGVASYESTDSNLSGQVNRLRQANPDIVIMNGTPTPTAAFMKYARLLNFRPKAGFLANYPMGDPLWVALIGASNAEGNHVSSYADLTGHNRVASAYRKAIAHFHGDRYSNYGLYGYFNATLFFKALKLAGHQLTRSKLQSVLDHDFRKYDTGFTGRINWTPSQHYGSRQFKMYRIHDGQFVAASGWLSP
jgi:branched-chain amino acid transport system substrate-binding protein